MHRFVTAIAFVGTVAGGAEAETAENSVNTTASEIRGSAVVEHRLLCIPADARLCGETAGPAIAVQAVRQVFATLSRFTQATVKLKRLQAQSLSHTLAVYSLKFKHMLHKPRIKSKMIGRCLFEPEVFLQLAFFCSRCQLRNNRPATDRGGETHFQLITTHLLPKHRVKMAVPAASQSFEQAKSYMKRVNGEGLALYDHIASVILKIVQDNPGDAVAQFEDISVAVKEASLQSQVFKDAIPIAEDQQAKVTNELKPTR